MVNHNIIEKRFSLERIRGGQVASIAKLQKPLTEICKLYEQTETVYELVERVVDIDEGGEGIHVKAKWLGLPDERDWTWMSAQTMNDNAHDTHYEFLATFKRKKKLISK